MKFSTPSIKAVLLFTLLFSVLSSCKKDEEKEPVIENNDVIPAAILNVNITGDFTDQATINLPDNFLSIDIDGSALLGIYSDFSEELLIQATYDLALGVITLGAAVPTLIIGTYPIQADLCTYTNTGIGALGFTGVSGTIEITQRSYITTFIPDKDYYISGNISVIMENEESPAQSITMTGTFSGVHLSE